MKLKLTKAYIDSVKPAEKEQIIWDTEMPGLHLKVTSAGKRVFLFYYRDRAGQQRRPALGQVGQIGLEQARELARKVWYESRYVLSGQTVQAAAENPVQYKPQWLTLGEMAQRYLDDWLKPEAARKGSDQSYITAKRVLTGPKLTLLAKSSCADVEQADLIRTYQSMTVQNGAAAANQFLDYIRAMWNWGAPQKYCPKDNPTEGIRRAERQKRTRVLKPGEYARVMKAMQKLDTGKNRTAMGVIKMELFSGLRCKEGRTLQWAKIDQEHLDFTFRAKGGKQQTKPLTKQVSAIIRHYGSNPDTDKYVFPGERADCISYNRVRNLWDLIRRDAGCLDVTLHDLRRSFLTYAEGEGIMTLEQAAEAAGHANSNITKRHYLHPTMGQRLRREQALADVLEGLKEIA